jgi:hypothetical protein
MNDEGKFEEPHAYRGTTCGVDNEQPGSYQLARWVNTEKRACGYLRADFRLVGNTEFITGRR